MRRRWLRRIGMFALSVLSSRTASAQRLAVQIQDVALGTPIASALVTATEQSSGARVFALTNTTGRAWLVLDRPGLWLASVRRIGLQPARATPIQIDSGETKTVTISTTRARFTLPTVRVQASAVCGREPVGEAMTGVLWDQMTLALRSSTLAPPDSSRASALQVELFERLLDRQGRRVSQRLLRSGGGTERPFFAANPDTLVLRGYVRRDSVGTLEYFAPDERVLLSEGFIRTHCFSAPAAPADPKLAELRFQPLPRRRLADVSGTAFIDVATGELRRIAFQFANIDDFIGAKQSAGGDVVLDQLADGRWIVTEWTIRMPTFSLGHALWERAHSGYREIGGATKPARLIWSSETAPVASPSKADSSSVPDTLRIPR